MSRKAEFRMRSNLLITTADVTLTKADVGKEISNRGATGTVNVNLPTGSDPQPGDLFEVMVDAAQQFNVNPGTGNKIQFGATLSNAGQVLRSSTLGDHQTFECLANPSGGPVIWRCKGAAGAWALV